MADNELPSWFRHLQTQHGELLEAVEALGKTSRQSGPLDDKTTQLIQLAAAAAIRSEGAVHSHTRRAMAAGATPEELYHALAVLTTTVGFPTVSAALNWADDIVSESD